MPDSRPAASCRVRRWRNGWTPLSGHRDRRCSHHGSFGCGPLGSWGPDGGLRPECCRPEISRTRFCRFGGIHRGAGVMANLGVIPAVIRSCFGAVDLFAELKPRLVVLTGGYASAPAGLVAVLSGTPLVIQEQNAHPGLVTRLLSRFAKQVHVAFPEAIDKLPVRRPVQMRQ